MRILGKSCLAAAMAAALVAIVFSIAARHATPASAAGPDIGSRIAGKPDFNGIWEANNTANWDLLTHQARPLVAQPGLLPNTVVSAAPVLALGALGWVPAGLGVVEGDEIPYQAWAAARKKENQEHWLDRDPEIKCFQPGIPRAMYMPHPFQIIQSAAKIQMIFEFANAQRTIHLTKMEPYPNVLWMGYSQGRWEGDVLVVDVADFTDATWFDRAGDFHSDALHVTERYTAAGKDVIHYEAIMEDPQVFTRPWKISMPLYRRLEPNAQLMDFKCVEMVEETLYGHLRKQQLVKHWEGRTMNVDITRKIPAGEEVYERYVSGNPPAKKYFQEMNQEIRSMQAKLMVGATAVVALLVSASPLRAHHAFAAEFDEKRPVHFPDATVTKVEFINPHSWIHVDVKQPDGTVENWAIEAGSPNILMRRGITRFTLKAGDKIVVDGYQSKDGTHRANGRDLTLPNGQKLFLGSQENTGAPYEVQRPGVDTQK